MFARGNVHLLDRRALPPDGQPADPPRERDFFIDNLLVQIHVIIDPPTLNPPTLEPNTQTLRPKPCTLNPDLLNPKRSSWGLEGLGLGFRGFGVQGAGCMVLHPSTLNPERR